MKNLLPLLLLLTLITFKLEAQVTKTVDLVTPGTLSTLLSSTEKSTVTNLIITGNLNAQDFKCLRDEVSELAVLDLSNTSIKAYNGTNGTHPGVSAYPDNQLPQYSFYTYTGISKDKLVQINLPNSITSIGNHSFYSCKGLTSISIPNTVTSIGDYAFQECSAMKSITLGSGLQTIGAQSIYKTGLKVINSLSAVPPALGQFALEYNYISIVYVPSSSVSLYKSAAGWQTLPITSDELVSVNNTTAGALAATLTSSGYQLSSISKLKVSGYLNSTDFEQIKNNMPLIMELDITDASIQGNSIPANAFYGKNIITTVKLPSTIENIGDNAFSSCSNLADILPLPSSLKTIGSSSFANCYSLTGNLVIPNTVTSIGNYAFNGCKGFNGNLILSDKLTSIPTGAFAGCTFLSGILNIPNSVTAIGTSAFFNCNKINELVIGNNCDSIGDEAFQRATSLSKITVFNPNPPAISASSFNVVPKSQVSVFVPLQSVGSYKTNTNWSIFPNINPISANGTFSITLQVLSGGSVSVNSVNQSNGSILYVEKDSTVTYTITPNVGYEIATILYDEIDVISQVTNGTFTTPALTANTTLSVSFRKITYKIHLSVSGGGVLKENSTILTDGTELIADKNSVRTFTVLPDEGYEIDTLFFGGVDVKTRLTGNQFITDPIVSNDTLKVTFKSSTVMYDIHVINGGNGKVLLGNDVLKNDTILNVKVNATRTFSFIPDTGYEIATLMYRGSDVKTQLINNQFTIPAVTANGVLSITFRKLTFEITIEASSGGEIQENDINLNNGTKLTADYNSTKTFVFVPSPDYEIATVTYGGIDVKSQLSNNQFTTPAITSNKILSVTFKKISFKIKIFKGLGGQLIENNINLADGANVEAEINTRKIFTINPADGYELATLTYNGQNVKSQVENNKFTTPSVISNDTLSVTFRQIVKIKQYGITFLIGNGGTITSGNLLITNNSILDMDSASVRTFTFVPEAGLEVATLTYGGKNVKSDLNNNQFTIPPITSNSTLSVTFRVITSTYEIAIHIGKGGSMKESNKILENNSIIEVLEDSVKTFTITPDVGYEVDSLYFGGLDVKSKLIDGSYTTDSIKSPGTLKVTFKKQVLNLRILQNSGGFVDFGTSALKNDTVLTADYGTKMVFKISPDTGYEIDSLYIGAVDLHNQLSNDTLTINSLQKSDTLKIVFAKKKFDINILLNTGGTIKSDTLVLKNDTIVKAEYGTKLAFSIIPNVGYELDSLTYGGKNVKDELVDSIFTTPEILQADTLKAVFKKMTFGIHILANTGGTVKLDTLILANDTTVTTEYGSTLSFSVVPDIGYEVDSISFGGVNVTAELTDNRFTKEFVTIADTLEVVFKKKVFDIKILANTGGHLNANTVALPNDTTLSVEYGTILNFSIVLNTGYELDSLRFGGENVTGNLVDDVFTTSPITAADTLIATFSKIIFDVLILKNDGGTIKLDTISLKNDSVIKAEYGSKLDFTIIPDVGYELDSLSYGGENVKNKIADNLFAVDSIIKSDTLKAVFKKIVFDVNVNVSSGGTVNYGTTTLVNDTTLTTEYGNSLEFAITPDVGYEIDSLYFGGVDVSDKLTQGLFKTDSILKSDTLTVAFKKQVFNINILPGLGGTVKLDTLILKNDSAISAEYGSELKLTITADDGYLIDKISYGSQTLEVSTQSLTYTITSITADGIFEVVFKLASSVSDIENPWDVKVYPVETGIAVDGVMTGDLIRVFTINGVQVASVQAESESVVIPISMKGIYLVNTKGRTVKVIVTAH